MKKFMFYVAFVASLGGLLFGFDTAVISGAEKDIQQVYGLSDFLHGFTMSSALIGTIIGALFSTSPVEKYGRQKSLIVIAVMYLLSAIGSALAPDNAWWLFIFSRFLGGLAVGASSVAGPLYIAEVSPSHWRGRFVAFFQFNIVLGIVLAYYSNYLIDGFDNDWRWMLGVEAFPALVFTALCPFLVESPRWLASRGKYAAEESSAPFFCRANLRPILLAFCVAFFNQLSGCNAVNYFAPRIFNLAGFERNAQFLATFGLGLLNFASTFAGVWLIDRLGRKTLLLVGGAGYVVSLAMASVCFAVGNGTLAAAPIFLFMAAHAVGQGTVIWVLIAEVFPQRFRAQGQALGSFTHWFFAALVALTFPMAAESVPAWAIFGFFGVMMVVHFLWALFIVPETKGRPLEDIQV